MENKYPLHLEKIIQSKNYALFLFKAEHKKFPIYMDKRVGITIQEYLSTSIPKRPRTFDCFFSTLQSFNITLFQTILYDEQENIYKAKMFLQRKHTSGVLDIVNIDARPSDALTLSILHNKPLFVSESVFLNGMDN